METFKVLLEHLGLSLGGLLIYSLLSIRKHLKTFSFYKFWNDNKPFWIWAFALQLMFAFLITFFPDSGSAIKTLTGMDLTESMAFLSSGAALAKTANWATGQTVNKTGQIGTKGNNIDIKK